MFTLCGCQKTLKGTDALIEKAWEEATITKVDGTGISYAGLCSKIYFFVRMCFPFYYFETLSECLIDGDKEEMLKVVNGVDNYEKYLLFMEDLFNIHLFSWIKKE